MRLHGEAPRTVARTTARHDSKSERLSSQYCIANVLFVVELAFVAWYHITDSIGTSIVSDCYYTERQQSHAWAVICKSADSHQAPLTPRDAAACEDCGDNGNSDAAAAPWQRPWDGLCAEERVSMDASQ